MFQKTVISEFGPVKMPCVILAEIGASHCGSYQVAMDLIRASALAGANGVKIQIYTPDQMTLQRFSKPFRIEDGPWAGRTLHELYTEAAMPTDWIPDMKKLADDIGLSFVASVFHPDAVPWLDDYGITTAKVSSFEIGYIPLLEALSNWGGPVILSTGTATLEEITKALKILELNEKALLKCTSQYPAPLENMNLATIPDMMRRFDVPVGLSDHTTGIVAAVAAVSLGASIIEKHIKIRPNGFDAEFSVYPDLFHSMVNIIRATEAAIGKVDYTPTTAKYKRRLVDGQWIRTVQ